MMKPTFIDGDIYREEYLYGNCDVLTFSLSVLGDTYGNEYFNYQIFPSVTEAKQAMYKAINTQ